MAFTRSWRTGKPLMSIHFTQCLFLRRTWLLKVIWHAASKWSHAAGWEYSTHAWDTNSRPVMCWAGVLNTSKVLRGGGWHIMSVEQGCSTHQECWAGMLVALGVLSGGARPNDSVEHICSTLARYTFSFRNTIARYLLDTMLDTPHTPGSVEHICSTLLKRWSLLLDPSNVLSSMLDPSNVLSTMLDPSIVLSMYVQTCFCFFPSTSSQPCSAGVLYMNFSAIRRLWAIKYTWKSLGGAPSRVWYSYVFYFKFTHCRPIFLWPVLNGLFCNIIQTNTIPDSDMRCQKCGGKCRRLHERRTPSDGDTVRMVIAGSPCVDCAGVPKHHTWIPTIVFWIDLSITVLQTHLP